MSSSRFVSGRRWEMQGTTFIRAKCLISLLMCFLNLAPNASMTTVVSSNWTVWTTSAHIITAVIGSGVLSLAWATAQLGWIAGPAVMFLFSFVTYCTSNLPSACYRSGDPVNGKRNYTYMDVVRSNLGGFKVKLCGLVQYANLFGVAIGYTIAASISMMSNCFHASNGEDLCHLNNNPYMIAFGVVEIIFSHIPDFDQLWWLSLVAAVMSFTYSTIGLCLGIAKVAELLLPMGLN